MQIRCVGLLVSPAFCQAGSESSHALLSNRITYSASSDFLVAANGARLVGWVGSQADSSGR
jgi:hypothetical protein